MRLQGKVAIVTGAATGIGQAIAIRFAREGAAPDQVQNLIDSAVKAFGKLDFAVNNAGVEKKFAFVDYPLEELRKILDINLVGPFLVSRAAAGQMIRQGHAGRLINISSVHEDLPMPTNSAYCVSKGGLRMLTRTIAVELGKDRITVNNIGPGAVFTPIDADVESKPEMEKALMSENPLGRWGNRKRLPGWQCIWHRTRRHISRGPRISSMAVCCGNPVATEPPADDPRRI